MDVLYKIGKLVTKIQSTLGYNQMLSIQKYRRMITNGCVKIGKLTKLRSTLGSNNMLTFGKAVKSPSFACVVAFCFSLMSFGAPYCPLLCWADQQTPILFWKGKQILPMLEGSFVSSFALCGQLVSIFNLHSNPPPCHVTLCFVWLSASQ